MTDRESKRLAADEALETEGDDYAGEVLESPEVMHMVYDRPWNSIEISRSTKGDPSWKIKLYQQEGQTPDDVVDELARLDTLLSEKLEKPRRW